MADPQNGNGGWMGDVQRALALVLIGTLSISILVITGRITFWGDAATLVDIIKNLQSALINMAMVALGFFFGSNMSKEKADASQQKVVERLTGGGPPVPPSSPWWTKLTDAEKTAITTQASSDARIAAFVTASTAGSATADDLDYLVSKGLLTEARADAIKSA